MEINTNNIITTIIITIKKENQTKSITKQSKAKKPMRRNQHKTSKQTGTTTTIHFDTMRTSMKRSKKRHHCPHAHRHQSSQISIKQLMVSSSGVFTSIDINELKLN